MCTICKRPAGDVVSHLRNYGHTPMTGFTPAATIAPDPRPAE